MFGKNIISKLFGHDAEDLKLVKELKELTVNDVVREFKQEQEAKMENIVKMSEELKQNEVEVVETSDVVQEEVVAVDNVEENTEEVVVEDAVDVSEETEVVNEAEPAEEQPSVEPEGIEPPEEQPVETPEVPAKEKAVEEEQEEPQAETEEEPAKVEAEEPKAEVEAEVEEVPAEEQTTETEEVGKSEVAEEVVTEVEQPVAEPEAPKYEVKLPENVVCTIENPVSNSVEKEKLLKEIENLKAQKAEKELELAKMTLSKEVEKEYAGVPGKIEDKVDMIYEIQNSSLSENSKEFILSSLKSLSKQNISECEPIGIENEVDVDENKEREDKIMKAVKEHNLTYNQAFLYVNGDKTLAEAKKTSFKIQNKKNK